MGEQALWRIISGSWAGWNIDGSIYNTNGESIGNVVNNVIFSLNGTCLGEIYNDKYVGFRDERTYPKMSGCAPWASFVPIKRNDIQGLQITGWHDPDF